MKKIFKLTVETLQEEKCKKKVLKKIKKDNTKIKWYSDVLFDIQINNLSFKV